MERWKIGLVREALVDLIKKDDEWKEIKGRKKKDQKKSAREAFLQAYREVEKALQTLTRDHWINGPSRNEPNSTPDSNTSRVLLQLAQHIETIVEVASNNVKSETAKSIETVEKYLQNWRQNKITTTEEWPDLGIKEWHPTDNAAWEMDKSDPNWRRSVKSKTYTYH